MDFAKKQLLKYGWKEGEGIGKEGNQGIATALKPKYKHGKEGMGFDMSKELVDTWWTRSYQDSLKRININSAPTESEALDEEVDDGVRLSFVQDESGGDEMSKMRRRMMRSNFQEFSKGAVLDNGMMVEEENSDSDDSGFATPSSSSSSSTKILSDEDLFKACGGRTAHKAARFGHKLSGKLARIAAQEEAERLTFQQKSSNQQHQESPSIRDSEKGVKPRKSKRKQLVEVEFPEESSSKIERKRRKKSLKGEGTMVSSDEISQEVEECPSPIEDYMDHEPSFSEGTDEKKRRKGKKGKRMVDCDSSE